MMGSARAAAWRGGRNAATIRAPGPPDGREKRPRIPPLGWKKSSPQTHMDQAVGTGDDDEWRKCPL